MDDRYYQDGYHPNRMDDTDGRSSRQPHRADSYDRERRMYADDRRDYSRTSSYDRTRSDRRPADRRPVDRGYRDVRPSDRTRPAGSRPVTRRTAEGYRTSGDYRQARDAYDRPVRTSGSSQQRTRTRSTYVGRQPSFGERVGDILAGYPWLQRGIVVFLAIVAILLVANVVSCVGGTLAPAEPDNAAVEASSSSSDAESSSSSASGSESSSSGAQTGVVSPWTTSGYFSTGDSALDNYVKEFCDQHSTEGKSFDANAYDANLVISTQADYVERENNQSPWGPDWDVEYAKQFFESNNSGNCYNFAAVTQFILQYFGYEDAEGQPCIVELESGNWGDHGLVFLTNKVDGKRAIVDDAMGTNGWMLDIDAYSYDVRNIAQNATVKGNTDALDDDDNPTPIPPGELTE